MNERFRFRGYREGDLDALFRLDEVCFVEPFRFSRRAMRQFAQAQHALVVIAEEGHGELAGFCVVHVEAVKTGRVGYVVTLDVTPAMRRQGAARELMERVEVEARAAGCVAMKLHVFTGNEAAIRFYVRMGYEFVRRDKGFYGAGVDALVYRKVLAAAIL
jgi:ribosomal-protein-alanine N-acetyltransferase